MINPKHLPDVPSPPANGTGSDVRTCRVHRNAAKWRRSELLDAKPTWLHRANNFPTSNWRCSQRSGRRGKRNEAANAAAQKMTIREAALVRQLRKKPLVCLRASEATRAHRARSAGRGKARAKCAQDLRYIGEEACERYEYVASLTVIRKSLLKYACACGADCEAEEACTSAD